LTPGSRAHYTLARSGATPAVMSRETVEVLEVQGEREALASRLASVERAYADLLQRVRRYERERAEIKARLERILARIGPRGTPGVP
jgi:chromosome segregation ATPase